MSMTGCPDLDQTILDFEFEARALRQKQAQVLRLDPAKDYSTLAARKAELADLEERFRVRGEKLALDKDRRIAGRALLMVVEQAHALRISRRRKPTARELATVLTTVTEAARRDRTEAAAEVLIAQHAQLAAAFKAASGESVLTYMNASAADA